MWRSLVILSFVSGTQFPIHSFASDVDEIAELDIRPLEETSTDAFSIFQILIDAREAFEMKDYEMAARHYGLLVKFDSLMEEPVIGLAKSQLALNRPDLAQELLSETTVSTQEIEVLTAIASALILPPAKAELILSASLKTHSDSRLWNLLGDVLIKTGQLHKAAQAFRAAETAGQRPGLLENNLGLLALHNGDFEVALTHLEHAVSVAPHSIKFDNNRRLSLLLTGDYIKALENLTHNRSVNVLTDAAIIASQRGDERLAKHLRLKAGQINPKHTKNLKVGALHTGH